MSDHKNLIFKEDTIKSITLPQNLKTIQDMAMIFASSGDIDFEAISASMRNKVNLPIFKYKLDNNNTPPPTKNNSSDAGYDLTLMELKEIKDGVYKYDTQVSIELPPEYYGMLVGRSSISKTGFMLANNVGIIDNEYRGNIIVGLVKINKDAADLKLPKKLVQLIPMKQHDFQLQQVETLSDTVRGDKGGLGSEQFKK